MARKVQFFRNRILALLAIHARRRLDIVIGGLIAGALLALYLPHSAGRAATAPPLAFFAAPRPVSAAASAVYFPFISINQTILTGLKSLVTQTSVTLPASLAASTGSWCTWGGCTIGPRLYHEPLASGRVLIGWTDASGNGHVSIINGASVEQTTNFAGQEIRGLVAHSDGKFGVLLWTPSTQIMWVSKRNADGSPVWSTNINSTIAAAEFWLGDGRLTYGNGLYGAYFTVKGTSGGFTGHYGDQLSYVNDSGIKQASGWDWGCSHSLAQSLSYHPTLNQFAPVCSSDCYASKGILVNDSQIVYTGDGNCGGNASAQLGQTTPGGTVWKVAFNAVTRPGFDGRGVALGTITGAFQTSYVWLTNTTGDYERDPVLGRLGTSLTSDRYLVGWMTTNDSVYRLGVINGNGQFIAGPEEVSSASIGWGNRDDSFRTGADGRVSWVYGVAGGNSVRLYRFNGASYAP